MDQVIVRRLAGTAAVVVVLALGYLGMRQSYAPDPGTYEVTAVLGRAGSGLTPGADVKARGVRVGEVAELRYDDGVATAVLRLDPEPPLPTADDLELTVTAKTLLGEKQVELAFPDDRFGAAPFLAAGDQVVASAEPTELQEVLDELTPFLEAIDGQDLATIFETLGEQRGEGDRIAENLELGQRLAAFGAETADANLANLRRLADVSESLSDRADDLTRLSAALPEGTAVLTERQQELRANLEALTRFSTGFAEFLEVEEDRLSRLMRTGQPIGAVLERQAPQIANLLNGLYQYTSGFIHGGDLDDGSEFALFRILIGGHEVDPVAILCDEAPDDQPFECPDAGDAGTEGGS